MLSQKRSPDSSGATQPQIHANRLNALKSTGPKTQKGKAVVSQNALKHGLSARHDVVITENQEDFDLHRDSLLEELAPQTPMESMLTDRIISLSWRLKRADLIQNQTIDAMHEANESNPLTNLTKSFGLNVPIPSPSQLKTKNQKLKTPSLPDLTLGRLALKDFANARVLDRLLMYERRIEHSLQKTILELQRLTLIRNLENPNPAHAETQPVGATPCGRPDHPQGRPDPPQTRPHPPSARPHPLPRQSIETNPTQNPKHHRLAVVATTTPKPSTIRNHQQNRQNPKESYPSYHQTNPLPRKTNPIPKTQRTTQPLIPQRLTPISRSQRIKKTNPHKPNSPAPGNHPPSRSEAQIPIYRDWNEVEVPIYRGRRSRDRTRVPARRGCTSGPNSPPRRFMLHEIQDTLHPSRHPTSEIRNPNYPLA